MCKARLYCLFLLLLGALALPVASAEAASVTLTWDAPTDGNTAGYIVWHGTTSGVYSRQINVGFTTTFEVTGLLEGTTYYFTVQAYGPSGEVSERSDQVVWTAPGVAPSAVVLTTFAADKPSPQQLGTAIAFSAAASGGAGALEYKFRVSNDGGSTWGAARIWGPSGSYTWAPTVAGAYQVQVWVRNATSTTDAPTDGAAATMSFVISTPTPPVTPAPPPSPTPPPPSPTPPPSSPVPPSTPAPPPSGTVPPAAPGSTALELTSLSADKASPQAVNTTITFTAAASGGVAPLQFKWSVYDGETWLVVQNWNSRNTFTWTPAVAGAGYRIAVRVRSATDTTDNSTVTRNVPFVISSRPDASGPLPADLQVVVTRNTVGLTWRPLASADGAAFLRYRLEVGFAPGESNAAAFDVQPQQTSIVFHGVPSGTFYVRVRGVTATGVSAPSNEVTVNVCGSDCVPAPGAASNLTYQNRGQDVVLSWDQPASGPPAGYVVEAGTAPGLYNLGQFPTGSPIASVTVANVPPGTYYVRVRATNGQALGGASNEIVIVVP